MSRFNLTPEVKNQLLTDRINQLSLEGYQHELNKLAAEAVGNEQIVQESNNAIEIIAAAIEVAQAQLNN